MSVANVELVRRGLDAFTRGDLEGMRAIVHPDIVTVRTPPLARGGERPVAAANIVVSLLAGLLAVWLGRELGMALAA